MSPGWRSRCNARNDVLPLVGVLNVLGGWVGGLNNFSSRRFRVVVCSLGVVCVHVFEKMPLIEGSWATRARTCARWGRRWS